MDHDAVRFSPSVHFKRRPSGSPRRSIGGLDSPLLVSKVDTPAKKPVSFWGLVALIFFSVSGGPFGCEGSVAACGPFWALVGFVIFPFIWCIPEALITAELSSIFPGNTGYVSWVTAAFGPYWGFIEGFFSWISGVINNAIYPHLFLDYLKVSFPIFDDEWVANGFLVFFSVSMAYVNYRGLDAVSSLGIFLMFIVLGPFLVIILLGMTRVRFGNFLVGSRKFPEISSSNDSEGLIALVNILFWNLNNWDSVSTISGEVENARKVIPKALIVSLFITSFSYILPLSVGIGLMDAGNRLSLSSFSEWKAGFFQEVAYQVGGWPLACWILIGAALGIIGQFHALLSSNSYQIHAMAELGWLPRWFSKTSKFKTPSVGIFLSLFAVLVQTKLDFLMILQLLNVVYCLAQSLEFCAFYWLRISSPEHDGDDSRYFRIPLGIVGISIFLILPFIFLGTILLLLILARKWEVFIFLFSVIVAGNLLYFLLETGRRRSWFHFIQSPPKTFEEVIEAYGTPLLLPMK